MGKDPPGNPGRVLFLIRTTTNMPAAQRVRVALTGGTSGSHEYVVEFSNAAGTTASRPLTVRVK